MAQKKEPFAGKEHYTTKVPSPSTVFSEKMLPAQAVFDSVLFVILLLALAARHIKEAWGRAIGGF